MPRKNAYREILVDTIRAKPGWELSNEVAFDQTELRETAGRLGLEIRNFPDITYSLRSRQSIPEALATAGFQSIEIRGRGRFALTRLPDKLVLPTEVRMREIDGSSVPLPVRELVRFDEQGILSVAQYLNLIGDFIGAQALRLQGHLRMTGGMRMQVEVDEVYVASQEHEEQWAIVIIEAKSQKERIGSSQIRSLINVARAEFAGKDIVPVALQVEREGTLLLVRFRYSLAPEGHVDELDIADLARYRVNPPPLSWQA